MCFVLPKNCVTCFGDYRDINGLRLCVKIGTVSSRDDTSVVTCQSAENATSSSRITAGPWTETFVLALCQIISLNLSLLWRY